MLVLINKIESKVFTGCDFSQLIRLITYSQYSVNSTSSNIKIKFLSSLHLSLPKYEIEKIELIKQDNNIINIRATANFLGIIGTTGVLPSHYTELIINAKRTKDTILLDLINVFYDKIIKLFQDITQQNSMFLEHEKHILSNRKYQIKNWSSLTNLIGITNKTASEPVTNSLLNYIGLLLSGSRSSQVLQTILSSYLRLPVEIEQFTYEKTKLDPDQFSKLGNNNFQLGKSLYLGHYADFYQNKITIKVYDLCLKQYNEFFQGLKLRNELNKLLDYYLDLQIKYNLLLLLKEPEKISALSLQEPRRLGFSMWLKL